MNECVHLIIILIRLAMRKMDRMAKHGGSLSDESHGRVAAVALVVAASREGDDVGNDWADNNIIGGGGWHIIIMLVRFS